MSSDILIVGQGLAGTALAWQLQARGRGFVIADSTEPLSSSRVAAGLVTPVTGMRLNPSWRIDVLLLAALSFYRRVEAILGIHCYHEPPQVRLFRNAKEALLWETRSREAGMEKWIAQPLPSVDPELVDGSCGGFVQAHSAWLDTRLYLESSRQWFERIGSYIGERVADEDLLPEEGGLSSGVVWQGRHFATVILARGWMESRSERFFPWLPLQPARGVIAQLRFEQPWPEDRILTRGSWILPLGDGTFRAGSTYETGPPSTLAESLADIQGQLGKWIRRPFTLSDPQAGIRPTLKKQRPGALGRHPSYPAIALFNGLGSKGVSRAPLLADMLLAHLLDGAPLDAEIDVCASND